jgi:glucokinase
MMIGIDLGGTKIAGILLRHDGAVLARRHRESEPERGAAAVVADIAAMVESLEAEAGDAVAGIGVGVPGQVDVLRGLVWHAPNLRWTEYPFGDLLSERLQRRVHVLNDVQAATYGEWVLGAARDARDAVCVFVGTGVGGGIISGGRLLHGAAGSAGAIGPVPVSLHGPPCRCGGRGCLEAYAGGWAIARRTAEAVLARPEAGAAILQAAGGDALSITASHLEAAANAGDDLATDLLEETGHALGVGAVGVVNALNPSVLILGGGVLHGAPRLRAAAARAVRLWALPIAARSVRIVAPALGGDAGALGAAAWARDCAIGTA